MGSDRIPIIILGGSDRKSTILPSSGRDKHPLVGCKGVDIRLRGRPIVEWVVQRLEESGCFGPIFIAGPTDVYRALQTSAELIETDGSFGQNIQVSLETVRSRHPGSHVGFLTCDVLPDPGDLRRLMALFREHVPCDLFFPLIRAPRDPNEMGAFAWKPTYRIVPAAGEPALRILPGHLVIVDPEALRLKFLYRLFQIGYNLRNRSIDRRKSAMVRGVLLELLYQDLLHILGGRLPTLTWTVLSAGIPAGTGLRNGTLTRSRLEDAMRRIFVTQAHRKRYPERRIVVPLVQGLTLALDIDTEEEARQVGGIISTATN